MGGFIPVPGQTIYGASKAAVKLLTEALYAECRGTRVHMTVVIPGGMSTNMPANSGVTIALPAGADVEKLAKNLTTPEQAAKAILDGMEQERLPGADRARREAHGRPLPGLPEGRGRVHRPPDEVAPRLMRAVGVCRRPPGR